MKKKEERKKGQFDAPTYKVSVITGAVFTANHLTDQSINQYLFKERPK